MDLELLDGLGYLQIHGNRYRLVCEVDLIHWFTDQFELAASPRHDLQGAPRDDGMGFFLLCAFDDGDLRIDSTEPERDDLPMKTVLSKRPP